MVASLALSCLFCPIPQAQAKKLKEEKPCPHITIKGENIPKFTDTEKRLICGDPKTDDAVGDSWKSIPNSQAKFSLDTFLQSRGYFDAVYEMREDGFSVNVGKPTQVKALVGVGSPPDLELFRKRRVVGEILTPALLDKVEQWTAQRLQGIGYACPEIKSEADPKTGIITVAMVPGEKQIAARVIDESSGGITPGILDRYNAFNFGKLFNGDLLVLSERRILRDGVLQGLHFSNACEKEGVVIKRTGIEGPPRLLTVGFGTNTEGLLLVKASWKNTRIGRRASLIDVTALASSKTQQVNATMNWYNFAHTSRRYIQPSIAFIHANENPYEISEVRTQLHEATSYDSQDIGLTFKAGPTLEFIKTARGNGPKDSHFLSFETDTSLTSHYNEFYFKSPRTGYRVDLTTFFNSDPIYSETTAERINLDWEALWNYRNFDPPLWVLGFRGGLGTVVSGERPGPGTKLPPHFLRYLGGSENLRGFGRQELTDKGSGAMSSVSAGVEWRWVESPLPFDLQPFVFTDLGLLGLNPLDFDSPLYWSPGLGIRWESPVGALRATLAHGYASGQPPEVSHLQFYFSFGEEF
ncbi:MAG: BamA/TamA family outer membrane protein [Methylotenera sp.]|nr:BamA/TamA family outer membrane protein [Oligoflexia bacterium]